MEMNADDLEGAINAARAPEVAGAVASPAPIGAAAPVSEPAPQMNPQEEVGFHKGALNTLVAERNELVKMVGNVDAIMQAHVARLKELGVEFK